MKEVKTEVTKYYQTCDTCGKDFEVYSPKSKLTICPDCISKRSQDIATKKISVMIGAYVRAIDHDEGAISSITLVLTDGRIATISIYGYGDDLELVWDIKS